MVALARTGLGGSHSEDGLVFIFRGWFGFHKLVSGVTLLQMLLEGCDSVVFDHLSPELGTGQFVLSIRWMFMHAMFLFVRQVGAQKIILA